MSHKVMMQCYWCVLCREVMFDVDVTYSGGHCSASTKHNPREKVREMVVDTPVFGADLRLGKVKVSSFLCGRWWCVKSVPRFAATSR